MAGQWYYTQNRQQQGPVSWEELSDLARRGEVRASDLVWQEGTAKWVKASAAEGLFDSPSGRGRSLDEEDAPRRSRRAQDEDAPLRARRAEEDDDRPARRPRPRDKEDADERPRRQPREGGMPVGLKIGLIVGSVVVVLLVVGVILVMVLRPKETTFGPFDVEAGGQGLVKFATLMGSESHDPTQRGPCHVYLITMTAGQTYTIDMRNNFFDSYLRLEDPNRVELDRNGGRGLNARIFFTPKTTATYRVIITSLHGVGRGNYSFQVRIGRFDGD